MVFGTPEFMSPEQAQGKALTPASDTYSLAVILYEVLTGKLPFDAKSAMDYIQLHVTGKPILLNARVPGKTFPPLLEQVIDRALLKKPEDRYTSAADFADALSCVMRGERALPARLAPAPPVETATPPVAVAAPVAQKRVAPPAAAGSGPKLPAAAPSGRALAAAASPGSAARSAQKRAGMNMPMLAAIAVGFLLLGVGLAMVLMKLLLK
jgi:serine/threonine-protein kinase